MALPIIPTSTSLGRLGQSFATGLQALADTKLKELSERQQVGKYIPFYKSIGFDEQASEALANQPLESQREIIKGIFQRESPLVSLSLGGQQQPVEGQPITPREGLQQGILQAAAPQKGFSLQQFLQGEPKISPQQQTRIEAENKPFLETFNQQFETARSLTDLANDALELINTGKTPEGVQGFLPTELLSEEGQRLDNIYNNIVRIIAAQEKGPLTKSRIALAQSTKPFFRQKRSVQKKLLEDLASKANPILIKKQIEQQLIERNRGFQPAGLQGKINKQYRLQTFGNPADYEADTIINSDGVRYKPSKDGTDWVPA